ncbi:MAG: ribokinase [Oceanospirillaceae bacterium]|jgi:ribokinase
MKIFNYGSINIDHIYQVPHLVAPGETISSTKYKQVLGGKGANQSIALAKAGANVWHIGRCNKSDQWALEQLEQAGVNCQLVEQVTEPSGHAIIQVDAQAENAIVLFGGANQSFEKKDIQLALAKACDQDWLLIQNECSCIDSAVEFAAQRQLKIILNPSPMLEDINEFPLHKVAMLVVNEVEVLQLLSLQNLTKELMISKVREQFESMDVIITLGAKGALWVSADELVEVEAYKVTVVDTTAAGDTFLGFLLAAISEGKSKKAALTNACKASSLAVQSLGASSSIPTAAQVACL